MRQDSDPVAYVTEWEFLKEQLEDVERRIRQRVEHLRQWQPQYAEAAEWYISGPHGERAGEDLPQEERELLRVLVLERQVIRHVMEAISQRPLAAELVREARAVSDEMETLIRRSHGLAELVRLERYWKDSEVADTLSTLLDRWAAWHP